MLLDFDGGKPGLPVHQPYFIGDYHRWRRWLTMYNPLAFPAIWAEVDGHFSAAAQHPTKQLVTMSWIPGENWNGTPYQDIYDALLPVYGHHDWAHEASAKFLGLIFMEVAIARQDTWGSGHYEHPIGVPIAGRTYFRL